jgi:hypothetical protein
LEQQILRQCEEIASGTISKQDLTNAVTNTCKSNGVEISEEKTKEYVDKIFKSAGGRRSIYRIQLKKAILDNIVSLKDI